MLNILNRHNRNLTIALFLCFSIAVFPLGAQQNDEAAVEAEKTDIEDKSIKEQEDVEMEVDMKKDSKRNFFQRLFGKPVTKPPQNDGCWSFSDDVLLIQLDKAPELSNPGGGIRIEGETLPFRVLVIHGDDGQYHAFRNVCTHGKRCLDPVPGGGTVQCCSVGKSTFDYDGKVLRGSAKENIVVYPVKEENGKLIVTLKEAQ